MPKNIQYQIDTNKHKYNKAVVIRNTNTKIIMRLSELEDRNDIGKSAALSDEQINEIPKLAQGVAVVYQNGWEESVLCKIAQSQIEQKLYDNTSKCNTKKLNVSKVIKYLVLKDTNILSLEEELNIIEEFEKDTEHKKYLEISDMKEKVRIVQELLDVREFRSFKKISFKELSNLVRQKVSIEDVRYEKLLVNFILVDLAKNDLRMRLNQIQNMINDNNIEDFISLAWNDPKIRKSKNKENNEVGVKNA